MRSGHRVRVLAAVLAAIVLAAAVPGVSALAGSPSTVYVGLAPLGGGSCASPDFRSLQAAVDAAGRGDTILVCPGDHQGTVRIAGSGKDGLTIRATRPWAARLRPDPPSTAAFLGTIIISGADRVTVQWLNLRAPTRQPCAEIARMISVADGAQDAVIRGNRMRPDGGNTTGACGYSTGISAAAGTSSLLAYNLIVDFKDVGISAGGAGNETRIMRNSIRYRHPRESSGSGFVGIVVGGGAHARVTGNHLVGLASADSTTPMLTIGISFDDGETSGVVRANLVRHAGLGLRLFEPITAGTGRVVIRDNEIHDNRDAGIWIAGFGFTGSVVRDNDFRGNGGTDCDDGSQGSAATWTNNLGDDANIAGICDPGVVVP